MFGGTPVANGVSFSRPHGIAARWVIVSGTFQYFISDAGLGDNGRVVRLTPNNFGQSWSVFELVSAASGLSVRLIAFELRTTSLFMHAGPSNLVFKVNANSNIVNSFQALSDRSFDAVLSLSVCGESGLGHVCVATGDGGFYRYDGSAFAANPDSLGLLRPGSHGILGGSLFVEYAARFRASDAFAGPQTPDIVVHDLDQRFSASLGIAARRSTFGFGAVLAAALPWEEPITVEADMATVSLFVWAVSTSESVLAVVDNTNGDFLAFALRSCPFASVWSGGGATATQPLQCVPLPCAVRASCDENEEPYGELLECTCMAGFSRSAPPPLL
jgi:hypothetical protein